MGGGGSLSGSQERVAANAPTVVPRSDTAVLNADRDHRFV